MRTGWWVAGAACIGLCTGTGFAREAFNCAGAAMAGGAELLCSHIDPAAPGQTCTFSWTLMTSTNHLAVVAGSFMLPNGVRNSIVYQGNGYGYALSVPVVLCQGRSDTPAD